MSNKLAKLRVWARVGAYGIGRQTGALFKANSYTLKQKAGRILFRPVSINKKIGEPMSNATRLQAVFITFFSLIMTASLNASQMKVLMLGNSYTKQSYFYLEDLLNQANIDHKLTEITFGQASFDEFAYVDDTDKNAQDLDGHLRIALQEEDWDIVVLQDNSYAPEADAQETRYKQAFAENGSWVDSRFNAMNLSKLIYEYEPNAKIIWYCTPAHRTDYPNYLPEDYKGSTLEYNNLAYHYYNENFSHDSVVAEIADAFSYSYYIEPARELHVPAGSHQNKIGRYLTACMFFSYMTGKSATGLPKTTIETQIISDKDRIDMQALAQTFAPAEITEWGKKAWEYDSENHIIMPVSSNTVNQVGETIILTGNQDADTWYRVDFKATYTDPIVILGPLSDNESDPVYLAIRNVTSSGFEYRMLEHTYNDGQHQEETCSCLVIERGIHTLADGRVIEAGSTTGTTSENVVSLSNTLNVKPLIFAQTINTTNQVLIPRIFDVEDQFFKVMLETDELTMRDREAKDSIINENINYIAVYNPLEIEDGKSGFINGGVYDLGTTINYANVEDIEIPAFFSATQTRLGSDPYVIRYNQTGNDFHIYLQEDTSRDNETNHARENFAYFFLNDDVITTIKE